MQRTPHAFLLLVVLAGCGADDAASDAAVASDAGLDARVQVPVTVGDGGEYVYPCFDLPPPTGAPTFLAVYREIFCASSCASSYCHGSRGESGGLSFETPAIAYASLVGAPAGPAPAIDALTCAQSELLRVAPGDPERSLLYRKLRDPEPLCGSRMPLDRDPLDAAKLTQLRTWIERGARDDGHDDQAAADAGH